MRLPFASGLPPSRLARRPPGGRNGKTVAVTIIKINAIDVDPESGDELARRFAGRAGAVDQADGFEGFELLRPTDERAKWLVMTRWRDEDAFNAWVSSPAFAHGHRGASAASPHTDKPLATHSEVWSYEPVDFSSVGGSDS
jgi:heme-degrading monooxygenase HmoA